MNMSGSQSEDRPWPCPHCGYDLRASIERATQHARCPECGGRSRVMRRPKCVRLGPGGCAAIVCIMAMPIACTASRLIYDPLYPSDWAQIAAFVLVSAALAVGAVSGARVGGALGRRGAACGPVVLAVLGVIGGVALNVVLLLLCIAVWAL